MVEQLRKPPAIEAHCRHCGNWLVTVPPGTAWATGRCSNRRCELYGAGQTVLLNKV